MQAPDNPVLKDQKLRSIIEEIDSPAILYCESLLANCLKEYRNLSEGSDDVRYALKACYVPEVARFIQDKQFDVEVMTVEEAQHAISCGWNTQDIDYDGCGRNSSNLKWAIDNNIHITLTSKTEIDTYIGVNQVTTSRHNVGIRVHTDHLKPAVRRFGIPMGSINESIARLNNAKINIDEFKIHGWRDDAHSSEIDSVLSELVNVAIHNKINRFKMNFGGGRLTKEIQNSIWSLREIAQDNNIDISVIHEPGAALVNQSCLCVTDIVDVQDDLVVVNCPGNMLPPLERAEYRASPLNRKGASRLHTVSGNLLCFHSICNKQHDLGDVEVGDRLIIEYTGAYSYNFTSLIGLSFAPIYWLDADYSLNPIAPFLQ